MSDKPISVGDLVVVARPSVCCGNSSAIGHVFKVLAIERKEDQCNYCHARWVDVDAIDRYAFPVSRLRRIQLFPELADEKHDEDMREPA